MRPAWFLAAIVAVAGTCAWGEDGKKSDSLLDKALDDAPAPVEVKKDQPAPPAKNQPQPKDHGTEVINPDAAKTVDEEDLVKKLTGGGDTAAPGGGPDKMLQEVVERMAASAQRLHAQDPGQVTQETQRRIVLNLDSLIELAKKQQQGGSSSSAGQRPGQKREKNPGNGQQPGQNSQGGNQAAQQSTLPGGDALPAQTGGSDIREKGKEWGNLPERDRDLIVHGAKEDSLPSYREMVQRYYQALSDIGKTTRENR